MTVQVVDNIDFTRYGNVDAKAVDFGFISGARYEDGQDVAAVATWNEFGTQDIPERPFFRQAVEEVAATLQNEIAEALRQDNMNLDIESVNRIGERAVREVQESITQLADPPNAPATVRRKGSTNPLIDTGFMRGSVTYEVET